MNQLTGQTQDHLIYIEQLNRYLHKDIYEDFLILKDEASKSGIDLYITSSFRSYESQLNIWNAKARGEKKLFDSYGVELDYHSLNEEQLIETILRWSAIPGASRHHWGTDLDIVDKATWPSGYHVELTPQEFEKDGPFYKFRKWFDEIEDSSSFFRPYSDDLGGVAPEMWHLSHRNISREYYRSFTLNVFIKHLEDKVEDILLSEYLLAKPEYYYDKYVMNIKTIDY